MMARLRVLISHYLTSDDGETYAIGRGLGLLLFLFGLMAVVAVAVAGVVTGGWPTLIVWGSFLKDVGIFTGMLVGSVVALITLTNPTEPKAPQPAKGGEDDKPPWERGR